VIVTSQRIDGSEYTALYWANDTEEIIDPELIADQVASIEFVPDDYITEDLRQIWIQKARHGFQAYAYSHTFDWTLLQHDPEERVTLKRRDHTICSCCDCAACGCVANRCEQCHKCYLHCDAVSENLFTRIKSRFTHR
jgi:hypothetical protein